MEEVGDDSEIARGGELVCDQTGVLESEAVDVGEEDDGMSVICRGCGGLVGRVCEVCVGCSKVVRLWTQAEEM